MKTKLFPKLAAWGALGCKVAQLECQLVNHLLSEQHPVLRIQNCQAPGRCLTLSKRIVLDAESRPLVSAETGETCYDKNAWDPFFCATETSCVKNCGLGGAKYTLGHGIITKGRSITLKLFNGSRRFGSKVFMLADKNHYEMFQLKNQEISFDVDTSRLPAGVNAEVYLTNMDVDGGLSSTNQAGARFGTGYCDATCPDYMRFINGRPNIKPPHIPGASATTGNLGSCCPDISLWEGNSVSQAFTARPCVFANSSTCEEKTCHESSSLCASKGCNFNPEHWGDQQSYGPGMEINSKLKFTVVTQFLTSDGTVHGDLVEIRRFYVQKETIVQNARVSIPNWGEFDSISDRFCSAYQNSTGSEDGFYKSGGMVSLGQAMTSGMVLVMKLSIGGTREQEHSWSASGPSTKVISHLHKSKGSASHSNSSIEQQTLDDIGIRSRHAYVKFSSFKIGPINSTHSAREPSSLPSRKTTQA